MEDIEKVLLYTFVYSVYMFLKLSQLFIDFFFIGCHNFCRYGLQLSSMIFMAIILSVTFLMYDDFISITFFFILFTSMLHMFLLCWYKLNLLLAVDMKVEITALSSYEYEEDKFKEQVNFTLTLAVHQALKCKDLYFVVYATAFFSRINVLDDLYLCICL